METKHKNALIGSLLAVVFVMAVGYAVLNNLLSMVVRQLVLDGMYILRIFKDKLQIAQPLEIIPQTQEILHMIQQQLILQLN